MLLLVHVTHAARFCYRGRSPALLGGAAQLRFLCAAGTGTRRKSFKTHIYGKPTFYVVSFELQRHILPLVSRSLSRPGCSVCIQAVCLYSFPASLFLYSATLIWNLTSISCQFQCQAYFEMMKKFVYGNAVFCMRVGGHGVCSSHLHGYVFACLSLIWG